MHIHFRGGREKTERRMSRKGREGGRGGIPQMIGREAVKKMKRVFVQTGGAKGKMAAICGESMRSRLKGTYRNMR